MMDPDGFLMWYLWLFLVPWGKHGLLKLRTIWGT